MGSSLFARFAYAGIVAALALAGSGCEPPAAPTDDVPLLCVATVANPQVPAEQASTMLGERLTNLSAPLLDNAGEPLRRYHVVSRGQATCASTFPTAFDAEIDWGRFLTQSIADLSAAEDPGTVFGRFPDAVDDWCVVPDTLSCTETDPTYFCPENDTLPPLSTNPLPVCDPPAPAPDEPEPTCIRIECEDSGEECDLLEFGDVPLGETQRRTVEVVHCGESGATVLVLESADGTVVPLVGPNDYSVPPPDGDAGNGCHPAAGDGDAVFLQAGESCPIEVLYAPSAAEAAVGYMEFFSNGGQVFADEGRLSHRLTFTGMGLGGALQYVLVGEPEFPEIFGFEPPPGGCGTEAVIEVTNVGPGAVTLTSVRFDDVEGGAQWVVAPTADEAAPLVIPVDETQAFSLNACDDPDDGMAAQGSATLVFDSNGEPPTQLLMLESKS